MATLEFLCARIDRVERVPGRSDAWLDISIDDEQHNHLRLTLLDAPNGIEAAEGVRVVLQSQFIMIRNSKGSLVRWAHRMSYCRMRLIAPG